MSQHKDAVNVDEIMKAAYGHYKANEEFKRAQDLWNSCVDPDQRKYASKVMEAALMYQREDNPPPPKFTYSEPLRAPFDIEKDRQESFGKLRFPESFANKKEETVEHPSHYNKHPSGIECIDIVRHMNFNLGNAMKYIWRCDLKADAVEDLKKAIFYLEDEVKRREAVQKD